ncbi:NAD(+)/NADH kinase [Halobacterium litoreum]|uniref:NAD kinase n=1 Tax=Halobacterium litoreum TaxID=2039234 RepID=A0ABD5NEN7_9EURY|nr:NAD(+)/NADH kinase [Halobacterium litoreum]UHH13761.1 NAD(+)/NADH kinase [Halobacterium litoreum]
MRVGIVAQRGNSRAARVAADVREMLVAADVTVWLDTATATALGTDGRDTTEFDACDLVVSIGGDGTFLFAARGAGSTPVLGVNLGEVGFLNAVAPDDAVEATRREVERFEATGEVRYREAPRVTASGEDWSLTPALNEVAVQGEQRGHGQGVDVEVRVDGSLYETTHADGVLVATPTGSTAYNLSEGGPLVKQGVNALVVTGMCASEPMPPLVVGAESEVSVRVRGAETAVVTSDGANSRRVDPPSVVTVETADEPARVAGPDADFFQALNKLE